jgi:hypothetical protein
MPCTRHQARSQPLSFRLPPLARPADAAARFAELVFPVLPICGIARPQAFHSRFFRDETSGRPAAQRR